MGWIQGLPWQVFWFGWGMLVLLAVAPVAAALWARRTASALAAQKAVDIRDLAAGYRLAWGNTLGPDLVAPLTGRSCVWWRAEVWRAVREDEPGNSGRKRHVWRKVLDRASDRPVLFGDGDDRAAVLAEAATVVPSAWSDWKGDSLPPEDRDPEAHRGTAPGGNAGIEIIGTLGPRFRYREQIIEEDAPVFALGAVRAVDLPADPAEDDEDVDWDGDDADDAVPDDDADASDPEALLGIESAGEAEYDADLRSAQWLISKAPGQPFILSTTHPETFAAEQDLAAKGGWVMGAVFGVLALWALWARV